MMRFAWPRPLDEETIFGMRKFAVSLLEYACNGDSGRAETDLVYLLDVTEGRDQGAMRRKYSSCGDLAHWMLMRIGVRSRWVNRDEHRGWRVGMNVALLTGGNSRPVLATQRFEPGDIVVVWNHPKAYDAHVICVIDHDGEKLLTAEYGQPGGALKARTFANGLIGNRKAQRWVSLEKVIRNADDEGLLVDSQDPTRAPDGSQIWSPPNA